MVTQHEFNIIRQVSDYDEYVRVMFQDVENVPLTVAKELGLPQDWYKQKTRKGEYVLARIITSYILRKHYGMVSSTEVSKVVGRGDHCVIHHYWNRADDAMSGFDAKLKDVLTKFDSIYTAHRKTLERERKKVEKSLHKSK